MPAPARNPYDSRIPLYSDAVRLGYLQGGGTKPHLGQHPDHGALSKKPGATVISKILVQQNPVSEIHFFVEAKALASPKKLFSVRKKQLSAGTGHTSRVWNGDGTLKLESSHYVHRDTCVDVPAGLVLRGVKKRSYAKNERFQRFGREP